MEAGDRWGADRRNRPRVEGNIGNQPHRAARPKYSLSVSPSAAARGESDRPAEIARYRSSARTNSRPRHREAQLSSLARVFLSTSPSIPVVCQGPRNNMASHYVIIFSSSMAIFIMGR